MAWDPVKMSENANYTTGMISGFIDSMRLLTPYFLNAGIGWKSEEQYDDYDQVAETLFRTLVLHPITHKYLGMEKHYRYDVPPYESSWGGVVVCNKVEKKLLGSLVRIESRFDPMDVVIFENDGVIGKIDTDKAEFLTVFK